MKLSRIDLIGLNGNDGLHYSETDILERLEDSTKINGTYPKDIADAIEEIKRLRGMLMSMTRKDFQAIALILRQYQVSADPTGLQDVANSLANYFKQANSSFDKDRFMRACGFYREV